MTGTWTVRRILKWTAQHFERQGLDSPRLTAEVLLAHALDTDRVRLYVDLERPLGSSERARFRALVERRAAGEPTQYLTGSREFYNRRFHVDARVLIPRPETELLVEAVLRALPVSGPSAVVDLCTGSGCIAVSVAAERPEARVWATDLSEGACAVARANAEALGVAQRCHVLQGDLDAPLPPMLRADVVVSNPPYIPRGELDGLPAEVRREPRLALDGGPDGLEAVRRVVACARGRLRAGGLLALELGDTQGDAVRRLLAESGYTNVRIERDWEHRERMALGTQAVEERG